MQERDLNGQLTNNFTLSFRSVEYSNQIDGGDWERDGRPGAAGEIAGLGFAFAQLVSMERYWRDIKASLPVDAVVNITGYSLGGHLATVFTELHAGEVNHTYTFNGAGRGHLTGGTAGLAEPDRIREMLQFVEGKLLEMTRRETSFAAAIRGTSIPSSGTKVCAGGPCRIQSPHEFFPSSRRGGDWLRF